MNISKRSVNQILQGDLQGLCVVMRSQKMVSVPENGWNWSKIEVEDIRGFGKVWEMIQK